MILIALSFSIFRSWSFRLRIGATTTLSPVCTPTGSTFSIPQIVIALSLLSRMTSNSISLYPRTLFSTNTWCTGLSRKAFVPISISSSSLLANPPPVPPKVKAGRRTTGYPISKAAFFASSRL